MVRGQGGQVVGGVGLREVPVWSAVERVDVRCRFEIGPVEEVRFEGLRYASFNPLRKVKAENQRCPMFDRRTRELPRNYLFARLVFVFRLPRAPLNTQLTN